MKKFLIVLLTFIFVVSFGLFTACATLPNFGMGENVGGNQDNVDDGNSDDNGNADGGNTDDENEDDGADGQPDELLDITGVVFNSLIVDYDGTPKTITVAGALATDEVTYSSSNTQTNAGIYNITATVKRDGYNDLSLSATLKINKIRITDVVFNGLEVDYDGQAKSIFVDEETLPDGVSVTYSGNHKTNAGTYVVTATLKGSNYITKTISANLKINKLQITGVVFNDAEVDYDGQAKSIFVDEETLPDGVSVTYSGNAQSEIGTYVVTATLKGNNYETLTITANLKIKRVLAQLVVTAQEIITKLLNKPEPWSFIPESLSFDSLKETSVQAIDFSQGFVDVNAIPTNGIGKQLNVMYSILSKMDKAIFYIDKVNSVASTLVGLYQTFLNDNPDDYAIFEKQMEHFDLKIELDGKNYTLLARFTTVCLELYYDTETGLNSGRVQLNDSTALKYAISENTLDISVKAVGVFAATIQFVRDGDNVTGTMFEFFGTENANIKTSALININSQYTTIMSDKRESDDLIIEGYAEVYNSQTGRFLGAEVKETVKNKSYDTMWFNLSDLTGIESIKVLPEQNFMNADTIFINGSTDSLHSKNVSLLNASRRFDIEMKEMFFYVYNAENEEFEKVSLSIPMLFVQRDYITSFGQDFYEENASSGCSVVPVINIGDSTMSYINSIYDIMVETYVELKELVTYGDITNHVGDKNSFFE